MDTVSTGVSVSGLLACAVPGYKPMTPLKLADRTSTATAPAFRQRLHPLHNMKKTFVEFRAKLPNLSG